MLIYLLARTLYHEQLLQFLVLGLQKRELSEQLFLDVRLQLLARARHLALGLLGACHVLV